jgi:hypothetical protein
MTNTYDYLPNCFDHQLWLILVDVMAAVPVARDGLDRVGTLSAPGPPTAG